MRSPTVASCSVMIPGICHIISVTDFLVLGGGLRVYPWANTHLLFNLWGGAQGVFTTLHLFISVSLFCGSALFCLSVWRSLSLIVRHTGWAMTAVCHWAKLSFPLARQSRKRERTERMNVMDHCCVPAFPMHMWKMWWHLSLTLARSYIFLGGV